MAVTTYFAVLPFVRNEAGELCPDEAIECRSAEQAAERARLVSTTKAGAVAFWRSGDPDLGEWADATIIARIGDVPTDLELVSGS